MSPSANATIATVGSGVMAEAMIAGLLRDGPGHTSGSSPATRALSDARTWSVLTTIRTVAG